MWCGTDNIPHNIPTTQMQARAPSSCGEPMIEENRHLVTNEPVEFEKWLVEAEDCMKITNSLEELIEYTPI